LQLPILQRSGVPEDIEIRHRQAGDMIFREGQNEHVSGTGDQLILSQMLTRQKEPEVDLSPRVDCPISRNPGYSSPRKGGVGKSNVVSNLAIALSAQGECC